MGLVAKLPFIWELLMDKINKNKCKNEENNKGVYNPGANILDSVTKWGHNRLILSDRVEAILTLRPLTTRVKPTVVILTNQPHTCRHTKTHLHKDNDKTHTKHHTPIGEEMSNPCTHSHADSWIRFFVVLLDFAHSHYTSMYQKNRH